MKRLDVAIAIIRKGSQILICQRKQKGSFGGYWEFPGGKVEAGETLQHCVCREITEEIAIRVIPRQQLPTIEHQYDHVAICLHPFICDHLEGEPQLIAVQAARWINPKELANYRFPEANDGLIQDLIQLLAPPTHRPTG